jgi:hypothetical protein
MHKDSHLLVLFDGALPKEVRERNALFFRLEENFMRLDPCKATATNVEVDNDPRRQNNRWETSRLRATRRSEMLDLEVRLRPHSSNYSLLKMEAEAI